MTDTAPVLTGEQIDADLDDLRDLVANFGPCDRKNRRSDLFDRTIAAVIDRAKREERERIADELAAWLDAEHAPPIWYEAVDIADPTWCDRHPEEATDDETR